MLLQPLETAVQTSSAAAVIRTVSVDVCAVVGVWIGTAVVIRGIGIGFGEDWRAARDQATVRGKAGERYQAMWPDARQIAVHRFSIAAAKV